jgi:hypothetical protein
MKSQSSLRMLTIALALSLASGAAAQTLEEEQAAQEEETDTEGENATLAAPTAEPEEESDRLGDEQAEVQEQAPAETFRDSTDPFEEENVDYLFLGAFYRHVVIPGFIQSLFVAGGIDGSNPGTGVTFNWRKNNFNINTNLWWNNAVANGFFRAQGDPRTDTEFVDVNLGVIFITVEVMWAFPLVDWFAIELGFDLGLGFIYGDLTRTEAYESSPGADDWQACDGPGDPNGGAYCEVDRAPDPCYANNGGHYDCNEANWSEEGGDIPIVFPWVALPHLAVRFKPIHQLQIRIDGGYGLYSFFFGGSVSYGF